MPITQSAKKALRRDQRRTRVNNRVRAQLRNTIKAVRSTGDSKLLPKLYSVLDVAAKNRVIHPNKAARLKSRITRQIKTS